MVEILQKLIELISFEKCDLQLLCHILRPFVSSKALRKVKHLVSAINASLISVNLIKTVSISDILKTQADLENASGGDICLEVLHLGTHVFKYDQTSST